MEATLSDREVRMILDAYERSYLYLDEVPSFAERRKALLDRRDRSVAVLNSWFRDNVQWDTITKVHARYGVSHKVTFEYPAESMVLVRTKCLDAESCNRILIDLKDMQPDILLLDLRGCTGDDPEAALELVGALAEGEICTQRFRTFDRVTVSRRVSVRPHMVFVFTDKDTEGCGLMAAVSLYLNSDKVTVLGVPNESEPVGKVMMEGIGSNPKLVFSMASYRWSVHGRGPEVFDDPDPERFIVCISEDIREMMSAVYDRIRERGWQI